MMGVLAMALFVLSHVVIARSGIKPALVAHLGERGYLATYSLLSLALLAWVVLAVLQAEPVTLWSAAPAATPFALLVTLVAFVLLGAGAASPNPLSVSFRKQGFDPTRPGLVGWFRHPVIWGLSLWGVAHIPANGTWPSLALFAGSALFGLVGSWTTERRIRKQLGAAQWQQLTGGAGHLDQRALVGAALGLAAWAGMLLLHPFLFGRDPLGQVVALFG